MILCEFSRNLAKVQSQKSYKIYSIKEFKRLEIEQKVYYINSNSSLINFLDKRKNYINLEAYFKLNTIYENLSVHRMAVCYGVKDGIIINANNLITIDSMWRGIHLGGFVMPGISIMLDSYKKISPALNKPFKSNTDLSTLPQKTEDAISYGILKPIILTINEIAKDKKIYLSGGDGQYFLRYFQSSIYDRDLVFNGMKALIKDNKLSEN